MEAELIRRAQHGDQRAFDTLATGLVSRFHAVAYRVLQDADLAQDAAQQALISIWRDLPRLRDPDRFDKILLDAPCSGMGVLRRNPDAKWSSQKKDVARFARRQARFLDHLAPLVKKEGLLVFAVFGKTRYPIIILIRGLKI